MSREYVDRGPYLCRYEACHGWVVYLNDAGDLKHLCSTNAEAKAKDIVGIMNADVARFDAKMRTPAPATAVEEARKAFYEACRAAADSHVRNNASMSGTRLVLQGRDMSRTFDALLAAEAADEGSARVEESRSDDRPAAASGDSEGGDDGR